MQCSTCWTEPLGLTDTLDVLGALARAHLAQAGSAGDGLKRLIDDRDYAGVLSWNFDYEDETISTYQMYHLRQAVAFFSKLEQLEIGIDKEQAAYQKFWETELCCFETNKRFRTIWKSPEQFGDFLPDLLAARGIVHSILGRAPTLSELPLRFGPGATSSIKKKDSCPQRKFAARLDCSRELLASRQFDELARQAPHWFGEHAISQHCEICEDGSVFEVDSYAVRISDSKLTFVPKNAKTYRTITPQPTLNGFVQAGIGDYMMALLKRKGLDLYHQTRNQQLCFVASREGRLATVDLSSASDTIAYQLVKFLLPTDWFDLLAGCRSGCVTYRESELIILQMFSAMGNFYTFPLESLIFWALTRAACCRDGVTEPASLSEIGVFGDDVILPVRFFDRATALFEVCGFTINRKKSFASGPFRESCGVDYLRGINIRPYYQDSLVSGRTLFTLHNYYYRSGQFDMAELCLSFIPVSLRLFGPNGYGDGHLLSERFRKVLRKEDRLRGFGGWSFATYTVKPRYAVSLYPGDHVSPLYSIYRKGRDELKIGFWSCSFTDPLRFRKDGRPEWAMPADERSSCEYAKVLIYTLGT